MSYGMLVESATFNPSSGAPTWEGATFRSCRFEDLAVHGRHVDEALLGCHLTGMDWYWTLFNTARIAQSTFIGCVFRGVSFRTCEFVECIFEHCSFVLDNLGGGCLFDKCEFVDCSFSQCRFIPPPPKRGALFSHTHWHRCKQRQCAGLRDQF